MLTQTHSAPLPGFVSHSALMRAAFRAMLPPSRVSVSDCAARHRRLKNPGGYSGPWRNDKTPYLVEPMNMMTSRLIDLLVMVGPSQFGKSELFLNFIAHAAKYRAGDVLMMQPTKDLAQDFAERRLEQRCLACSPDLAGELAGGRGSDKVFSKIFRNGTRVDAIWPVAAQLASRPVPTVLIDERDRIADDIDGEGDPRSLAQNRVKTFGANGLVAEVSSPAGDAESAIIADYLTGNQNLWFWPCLECGEFWSPGFDGDRKPTLAHLSYRAGVSPDEAADTAALICPHCGAVSEERHKAAMNARGAWVPLGCAIDAAGNTSGAPRPTRTASYWFCGLASPFESLRKIVRDLVEAEQHFERTGDEQKLKTCFNTVLGFQYRAKGAGAARLEASELEERRETFKMRVLPAGVLFLTAAVDIGADRFDVSVKGWGADAESWLVDRFAIRQLADGKTDIRPGEYPEHWLELIDRVFFAHYELAERPVTFLPIATVAVDTGGVPGVWPNAQAFYWAARERHVPHWAIMLVKGASEPKAPALRAPSVVSLERGPNRGRSIPFYVIGVSTLKDTLDNRLRRAAPGPGYLHLPADLPAHFIAELAAEQKIAGEWIRKGANETWDLEVYNEVARQKLRPHRINWLAPPVWAQPITLEGSRGEAPHAVAVPALPAAPPSSPAPARVDPPAGAAAIHDATDEVEGKGAAVSAAAPDAAPVIARPSPAPSAPPRPPAASWIRRNPNWIRR